ncbi:type IV pilus modification protein PilV [Thiorhodococcus mannitoliphagus]|nr:type IV pilus modification protein PilV [Thiorhodococcus mannitoliphagus]
MRKQDGFGLIEVLVAMTVLAIGILGMAHLHASALKLNHSAAMRSAATGIAYDIIDRMRANRAEALTGAYDGQTIAATAPSCSPGSLSGTTVAQRDIQSWRTALACTLPQGTGSITRNGSEFTVVTQWDDSRGESAPQRFVVVVAGL